MDEHKQLDCCANPVLKTVTQLLATDTETAAVRQCMSCGCHWFYRLREYNVEADTYDRKKWFVRMTADEAAACKDKPTVPPATQFAGRPGFLRDEDGMAKIVGVPYFLQ